MIAAFLSRDGSYDGVFFTGVRTTGIFCRPTCPAKKPREDNVEFFPSTQAAVLAGFRPCKRCRPMEPTGSRPAWLRELMRDFDAEPERRWTDQDLRDRGLSPERVRRWFQSHHEMTFHAYGRARRLGLALGQMGYLYAYHVFISWLPSYLTLERGMSIQQTGFLASLPFIVGMVATIAGGWLGDYLIRKGFGPTAARKTVVGTGMMLATILVITAAYTPHTWL
ncbi:MAG: MFS transporter, partial [Gemmatimonadetes bacterium]|nr:MFS transporter [Gemmatimonadota bacterium]